ncbi:hypothetical protein B1L04_01785 [Microcystis aeruginosa KW]|uniref:(2Fe-2S)-binding protein n=1 Tax=Microcystis aeruginosa KW TaxID=1960155 RepID=A0A1V4BZW9_MICAE|nr:hypothetical protein B1L04_01785 [Microcystis aeruginosa KW]
MVRESLSYWSYCSLSEPTGCLMGSCHACEVELDDGTQICSCITGIPGDRDSLTVHLYSDPLW